MTDPTIKPAFQRATPSRPLLGLTVLVVEDSLYACDAMRLLCLRSGARIRRADCLTSARRHLRVYRPTVVIVDMGLPDGNGAELIAQLSTAVPRVSAILGMSGDVFGADLAIAAGADGFIEKPITSLVSFQSQVLTALPAEMRPNGPRPVVDQSIDPDPMAYRDDLTHAAELLQQGLSKAEAGYVAQFLAGIARSAGDAGLLMAADALADGADSKALLGMLNDRIEHKIAI